MVICQNENHIDIIIEVKKCKKAAQKELPFQKIKE